MDATTAVWIGFLGALVGGIIGGVGSYLGSTRSSKKSINLALELHKLTAQAQLHRQLEYSIFKIDKLCEHIEENNLHQKLFYVEHLIYDVDWHKHLAVLLDDIPVEHQDTIVLWFDSLVYLISRGKNRCGFVRGEEILEFSSDQIELKQDLIETVRFIVSLRQ